MAYWQSRGLRGSELESIINTTNELYRTKNLALIHKIPTPITPIKIDKEKRVITLAYFEQKSTVDYIGVAQEIAICFDAKETNGQSLPLANIHKHQLEFMADFVKQGGVAFFIIHFKKHESYYLLPYNVVVKYYDDAQKGGRKSIPHSEFLESYPIFIEGGAYLNYLKPLQNYIDSL
ncbi:MAG: Holliday junction resolvase RecU [Epulopiscium sp. Nele67-Bin005]|nr:MAG: Holliday junction resolvase RecU [Epulopiscium sp. Nele67-Bin005]